MLRFSAVLSALAVLALVLAPRPSPAAAPVQSPLPDIVPGVDVRIFSNVPEIAGDYHVREVRGTFCRVFPMGKESKPIVWFNFDTIQGYRLIR